MKFKKGDRVRSTLLESYYTNICGIVQDRYRSNVTSYWIITIAVDESLKTTYGFTINLYEHDLQLDNSQLIKDWFGVK